MASSPGVSIQPDVDAIHPNSMLRQGPGGVLGDSGKRGFGGHVWCKEWKSTVNHNAEDIDAGASVTRINAVSGEGLQCKEWPLGIWIHDRVPLIGCGVEDGAPISIGGAVDQRRHRSDTLNRLRDHFANLVDITHLYRQSMYLRPICGQLRNCVRALALVARGYDKAPATLSDQFTGNGKTEAL